MIKDKLKYEEDLLDGYSGSWFILWFCTDGKSYRGFGVYDTEEAAIKGALESDTHHIMSVFRCGTRVRVDTITHFIPMPIGDS